MSDKTTAIKPIRKKPGRETIINLTDSQLWKDELPRVHGIVSGMKVGLAGARPSKIGYWWYQEVPVARDIISFFFGVFFP